MKSITRLCDAELQRLQKGPRGRLLAITGARQCGKSTLAAMAFPDYPVISLDSPVLRASLERLPVADWLRQYPRAVVDEAQKLPSIFETLKACYDQDRQSRYILLGSSQLLLLKQIRETLAGRIAIQELFPFSLPELCSVATGADPVESRWLKLLRSGDLAAALPELFTIQSGHDEASAIARDRWEYFLHWGGMPAIIGEEWSDADRAAWLEDYHLTYLQRDLADIARLDRLEPFSRVQKAAALRTAQPINFSDLARLGEVSPPTARQFLHYLEISYQTLLLPAWYRNQEKRLVKQPKLHFLDPGIRRAILKKRGDPDGAEFESAVVAEAWKQVRTFRLPVEFHHLRTLDGREMDFLVELENGFLAIECKQTQGVDATDFRHFRNLESVLDKPVLAGIVVASEAAPRAVPVSGCGFPTWTVSPAVLFS
jgi:predicted AAA+ superfamily ATPase